MALLKPAGKITWAPSASPDVVVTRVFWSVDGSDVTYESPFVDFGPSVTEAQLPLAGMAGVTDGDVKMGIAAVDDAGNISDIVQIVVPLDVEAPEAPTGFAFIAA